MRGTTETHEFLLQRSQNGTKQLKVQPFAATIKSELSISRKDAEWRIDTVKNKNKKTAEQQEEGDYGMHASCST